MYCGPGGYGDVWIVPMVTLSWKDINAEIYDLKNSYPTTLVFVSGPNCNARRRPLSFSTRTFNTELEKSYGLFKEGVSSALRVGLVAMVADGCIVAIVASVSCGIYAPEGFNKVINEDFKDTVQEVLDSHVCIAQDSKHYQLRCYFDKVIRVKLR